MFTKGLIQQIIEKDNRKESFNESISNLIDRYTIKDNVFEFRNNTPQEVIDGYFVLENEYDSFSDAMKNFDIDNKSIRILENKKFQTGTVYHRLSDCPEGSKIFDISVLENVR